MSIFEMPETRRDEARRASSRTQFSSYFRLPSPWLREAIGVSVAHDQAAGVLIIPWQPAQTYRLNDRSIYGERERGEGKWKTPLPKKKEKERKEEKRKVNKENRRAIGNERWIMTLPAWRIGHVLGIKWQRRTCRMSCTFLSLFFSFYFSSPFFLSFSLLLLLRTHRV